MAKGGGSSSRRTKGGRDQRVDALRGLALMSMFVAHCAPSDGPMKIFNLSEFLTAPLFALLIGMGAQLGDRGVKGLPTAFVRAGIRAAVLVALSLWLMTLGAQVDTVLMYLALPTLLAPVLARLPSAAVAVLATVCWAAAPTLQSAFQRDAMLALSRGDLLGYRLWSVTFTGEHYRLTGLLLFSCLGILIERWVRKPRVDWHPLVAGLGLLGLSAVMMAAKGRLGFEVYDGSRPELFFDGCFAAGVTLVWMRLVPAKANLTPLSVCGAMTLSVYTLQIIYLAWYVTSYAPGQKDDSWFNVGALCLGAVLLPMLWRSLVSREPWSRGPIEGPTHMLTQLFR